MSKKKIAIIDYGMGNLKSVEISLNYLGLENKLIRDPKNLKKFSHIILPGVGSFKRAIKNLKSTGMFKTLIEISKKKGLKQYYIYEISLFEWNIGHTNCSHITFIFTNSV